MKFRSLMTAICILATANLVSAAPFAYIANSGTKNVSVIDTADNTIKATVTLPLDSPKGLPYAYSVAVGASGQYVYVGLQTANEVVVIDAATNSVVKRISLGNDSPGGLAVNTAETRLYVASNLSNTLIVVDITGSGATEVGRVTVDTSAISGPEGVAILSDSNGKSLKVYVANFTKGTVAVISLDETNNIYTRTSLITVGNNPVGLTLNKSGINSSGSKLYVATLNGSVAVIDTATDAVIASPVVGSGTNSVAVKPDDTQVYAPANIGNKIYVIDGTANTVSGTTYSAINAPKGSSVTPDGTKLFLTMNASTSGQTVQVFNTANLGAAPAVITLPAGALPNSMGDFIGPEMPWTIVSSQGANCTVVPSGNVLVANNYGRTFSITPTSGACEVFIDGTSVGQPNTYTFSNVTANGHTINASQATQTPYYTLSGNWITSVGGWLNSDPLGINKLSKSAQFTANSTVTLSPAPTFQVRSGSWTGDCAGSGATCTLTMNAAKTFGAEIIVAGLGGKVKNVTRSSYHDTGAAATAAATTGDYLMISNEISIVTTTGSPTVTVKMSSQWDKNGYSQKGTYASLALTITDVAVIADDLVL